MGFGLGPLDGVRHHRSPARHFSRLVIPRPRYESSFWTWVCTFSGREDRSRLAQASSKPLWYQGLGKPFITRWHGMRIAYDLIARKHHMEKHYRGAVQINPDGDLVAPSVFTAWPAYGTHNGRAMHPPYRWQAKRTQTAWNTDDAGWPLIHVLVMRTRWPASYRVRAWNRFCRPTQN